nr:unnamed protein product [Digitaria exilis]
MVKLKLLQLVRIPAKGPLKLNVSLSRSKNNRHPRNGGHLKEREADGLVIHLHQRAPTGNQPCPAIVEEQLDVGDGVAEPGDGERGGLVTHLEWVHRRSTGDAAGGRVERVEQSAIDVGAQRGVSRHLPCHDTTLSGAGVEVEGPRREWHGLTIHVDAIDMEVVATIVGVLEEGDLVLTEIFGEVDGGSRRRHEMERASTKDGGTGPPAPGETQSELFGHLEHQCDLGSLDIPATPQVFAGSESVKSTSIEHAPSGMNVTGNSGFSPSVAFAERVKVVASVMAHSPVIGFSG